MEDPKPKGFAWLKIHDPEKLHAIASKGGLASQKAGGAHQWTEEEAKLAGQKGAKVKWARRRKAEAEEDGGG